MISKGWHCCWSHYWSSMAGVTYSQVSQSYGSLGHREKCLFMLVVWHLDIHKNPLLRLDLVKERRQLVDKLMCVEDHRLSLSTNWCVWKIIGLVFRQIDVCGRSSTSSFVSLLSYLFPQKKLLRLWDDVARLCECMYLICWFLPPPHMMYSTTSSM